MTRDVATEAILIQDSIAELAKLSLVEYDLCRNEKADMLGVRVTTLDAEVGKLRPKAVAPETGQGGTAVTFPDIEDWPAAVNGAELLDAISSTIERWVILPVGGAVAFALWVMHTYLLDAADVSPILAVTSPEMRCGKTRALEIAEPLTKRPLLASNITPAAVYRTIEAHTPCLLIDEADSFLKDNEELRGVLNSSHRKPAASVIRLVGDEHEPRRFSTWSAKAIATIGKLPGTLEDRSIQIRMRRKTAEEKVEPWRQKTLAKICEPLRRQASKWAEKNMEAVRGAEPIMPNALDDRAADNWRPLFAIANVAGGDWLKKATAAALALSTGEAATDSSVKAQLLSDIREMFEGRDTDRLSSENIVNELKEMEDRPWPEWRNGKPISATQLARVLKPFGVGPKSIRIGSEKNQKGYVLESFQDAFARYIPLQPVTTSQPATVLNSSDFETVTEESNVTDEKQPKPATGLICDAVTDQNPEREEDEV